jgi:hypothetical protein
MIASSILASCRFPPPPDIEEDAEDQDASTTDGAPADASDDGGQLDGSGPARASGIVVAYDFSEQNGTNILDRSGVPVACHLTAQSSASLAWMSKGVTVTSATTIKNMSACDKVIAGCASRVTVEAWIKPASSSQTGTIFALESGSGRAFALLQVGTNLSARIQTSLVSQVPLTNFGSVSQIAFVYDGTSLFTYENGVPLMSTVARGSVDPPLDAVLTVSNNLAGTLPWLGELHFLGVYCRGLTAKEIEQNYAAGPRL